VCASVAPQMKNTARGCNSFARPHRDLCGRTDDSHCSTESCSNMNGRRESKDTLRTRSYIRERHCPQGAGGEKEKQMSPRVEVRLTDEWHMNQTADTQSDPMTIAKQRSLLEVRILSLTLSVSVRECVLFFFLPSHSFLRLWPYSSILALILTLISF
jgi:hypothetical protein